MPLLQLHQLRVAAVAKFICEKTSAKLPQTSIIEASLLHDMGNLLKFNLRALPHLCEPEGVAHWEGVKEQFSKKYGTDEHAATHRIAEELGCTSETMSCLSAVGFTQVFKHLKSNILAHQVCCYADQRVGPFGILSLEERFQESRARRIKQGLPIDPKAEELYAAHNKMEALVLSQTPCSPNDITDKVIAPLVANLKDFEI